MVVNILAFADDLTGALEVGAKFASAGILSSVTADLDSISTAFRGTGALVIDTETRHLDPTEARSRLEKLARQSQAFSPCCIYHKSDTALRGNIGCEFLGIMNAFPDLPLYYAPAYPQMCRTVSQGHVYVGGRLLSETDFAHDRLNPSRQSYVPAVLSRDCGLPQVKVIASSELEKARDRAIYVCDAETESDLQRIARFLVSENRTCLAAGSAGLAEAIAELIDLPRVGIPAVPPIRTCLVVNGSLHDVSQSQETFALQNGFASIEPGRLPDAIPAPGWVVLKQGSVGNGVPLAVARNTGEIVRDLVNRLHFDGVLVFGGDTAYGIVSALGRPCLHPLGEAVEGVPISRLRDRSENRSGDLYLISKAGSFGPLDVLPELYGVLNRG